MKLEIFNKTAKEINVTLEPIGDGFGILPGTLGEISLQDGIDIRFDIYSENQVNIWVEGDVTVDVDNVKMQFPDIT